MMDLISRLRKFQEFLLEIGAGQTTLALPAPRMLALPAPEAQHTGTSLFVASITEPEIVSVARDLFASGHYSLAAQEAFKAVEKYVQLKSDSALSGTKLMELVFSPDKPVLFWSNRKTQSEKDEQAGYQRLYSGSMLGIRNPCTHEFNWIDDEITALEVLLLAQHLLKKAKRTLGN